MDAFAFVFSILCSLGTVLWTQWYVRREIRFISETRMKKVMPEGWNRNREIKQTRHTSPA